MLTVRNVSHDPFYNQAFEEYIYQAYLDDDIFLLWQNAPAVVVGSYQNICREVHVEALRQRGIPVVRRISGGGTVYHDLGNVNYTYIIRTNGALDYDAVLSPVIAALNEIGVPARKNRTCDIAIGDLKISGSAQRMTKGRLLHHGTLLFSSDLGVLDQITTHRKNDCFQSRGTQSAICTVTNIREHLASPMTIEEFQDRLLAQMVPPGCPHLTLTAEQEAEVCRLRDVGQDARLHLREVRGLSRRAHPRGLSSQARYRFKRGHRLCRHRRRAGGAAAERRALRPGGVCRHLPSTGRRRGGGIDGLAHVKQL